MERELTARDKAVGGINEETIDTGKDLERFQDEAGASQGSLASSKTKLHSTDFKLDVVREWSEGANSDRRSTVGRDEAAAEMERSEAKRL